MLPASLVDIFIGGLLSRKMRLVRETWMPCTSPPSFVCLNVLHREPRRRKDGQISGASAVEACSSLWQTSSEDCDRDSHWKSLAEIAIVSTYPRLNQNCLVDEGERSVVDVVL
jgi:hypothetical protein